MELRKVNLVDAYAEWEYTSNLPEDEIYLRLLKTNIASLRVMEKMARDVLEKMKNISS